MKKKYLVGYCRKCGKNTKHEVIRCEDNIAERLFLGIVTLGISEATGHLYECECIKCGEIRSIST